MTSTPTWRRRSGIVSARTPHAARAGGFLDGAQVVALIESDPEAPYAVAVTIATDADDRVAVVDSGGQRVVPGPGVAELTEALARECQAYVAFDEIGFDATPEPGEGQEEPDDDPFDPEIDVVSARVPDRAVVLTPASLPQLESLATAAGVRLHAAPHGDDRLVLIESGAVLTELTWAAEHLPAVLLERGAVFPSVALIETPERAQLFTWDAALAAVPTEDRVADLVATFIDAELGAGALVRDLAAVRPEADPAALRTALERSSDGGPAALVAALGLPDAITGFLAHEVDANSLDDVVTIDPVTVTEAMRRAAHLAADEARAGAYSLYESAEEVGRSWVPAAAAGVELGIGLVLVRRAGRSRRAGGRATAGERALGIIGIVLLSGALLNGAVATLPRVRQYLSSR
ncbi:hypothetical protein [Occultella kanbiaonis]|uniref:hypothetical protein n=1 Tax=Occultella kanbiaonis TaxID=2675754 RepID=UPI0013D400C9|nr:hypothetical protein [Occultella kanbiaonis]